MKRTQPKISLNWMYTAKSRGANLAVLAVLSITLVAFMGVVIYLALQAYVHGEIQKAASTAALAGAASYYSGVGGSGKPTPDPGRANSIATSTFNTIVSNSGALRGFGIRLDGVNAANNTVTVQASGALGTPLLAPIGIQRIEVTAEGTARAAKYLAAGVSSPIGPITIVPANTMPSMQRILELAFPLVDGPGTDLFIGQIQQQAYMAEACNDAECYDLTSGATFVGGGKFVNNVLDGSRMMVGSAYIDLERAGIRKASKLRFTHGNTFVHKLPGSPNFLIQTAPTALMISTVDIYGYSYVCPSANNCGSPPVGLAPMP